MICPRSAVDGRSLRAWVSSLCRGYGDVGRLLTSVAAAAGHHGNEYNNNNNGGGGGAVRDDVDGRRLVTGGGKAASADDVERPLNLEVHKRPDTKLERPDSRNVERDSVSGKAKSSLPTFIRSTKKGLAVQRFSSRF